MSTVGEYYPPWINNYPIIRNNPMYFKVSVTHPTSHSPDPPAAAADAGQPSNVAEADAASPEEKLRSLTLSSLGESSLWIMK